MSRAGFSLVEMLIVVAIIMILAAMLFPVYEMVTKRAESVECAGNMRHLAMAVSLYAEDCDGLLVPARLSYGSSGTAGTGWDVALLPYHRVEGLYLCSADQTPTWAASTVCYKHSYGINLDLTMVNGYNGNALSLAEVESPTATILFFEILGSARALGASYPTDGLSKVDTRHHEGANFSFVDGHAKWYRPRATCLDDNNMWIP